MNPTPQRFEIGQEVTPRKDRADWMIEYTNDPKIKPNFPRLGEIYTIASYGWEDNLWYVTLKEMPPLSGYAERGFDPVGDLKESLAALKSNARVFEPEVTSMLELTKRLLGIDR